MPDPPNNRSAAVGRIPRWKRWLMVPALPALAGLGAWLLHKSIVDPDASSRGDIWLGLALLLMFGAFTLILPLVLLANRRLRRPARERIPSKTPQPLTIDIPKRSPIYGLAVCILLLAAGILMSVAGFESVGKGATRLLLAGLLLAALFALITATHALQHWNTRGRPWQIRIDADGISDSRLRQFLVSWSDVVSIRQWTVRGAPFVAFDLRDAVAYRKSLNPLERLWAKLSGVLRADSYTLGLYALNVGDEEFFDALRAFKPASVPLLGFPDVGAGSSIPRAQAGTRQRD